MTGTTTLDLLSRLRGLDMRLWIEGDRLRYSAAPGALSPELRLELSERKAEIIEFLREAGAAVRPAAAIAPVARGGALPLSFAQQRLWFLDQLEPGGYTYNISGSVRLRGVLDIAVLARSASEIYRRHEALRATFLNVGGKPVQQFRAPGPLPLPVVDLSGLDAAAWQVEARRLASEEARRPFHLADGPLVRATMLRRSDREHVLLLTMHHIVSDGWSIDVWMRELEAIYGAFAAGRPSALQEPPIQYADFSAWQRQWFQGEVSEAQVRYWKKQLGGKIPVLQLPTDRPRPAVQTFLGASESVVFPQSLLSALKSLAEREDATLFMTLQAAFQTLLARYSGQDDILVGSPVANRNRSEIEGLIGFFVNTLILRADFSDNPAFRQLLGRVRAAALGAQDHQDLPYEKLVEVLQPERNLSYNPLFQVMFSLQNAPMRPLALSGLEPAPLEFDFGTAKFDLTLFAEETADGLAVIMSYATDLFDAATIRRMLEHYRTLLESIVADPDRRVSDLPMLTAGERRQLLEGWNNTRRDYRREACVHALFEEQVARTPDAIALVAGERRWTYRELNARANQLAQRLRKIGAGPDVLVGLAMDRTPEMIAGLFGILKSGAAYVPIDPTYPKERLAHMLASADIPVLLSQNRLLAALPEYRGEVVLLEEDWVALAGESDRNPAPAAGPTNRFYAIFTSGSTGRPKSAAVFHRGFTNLVEWFRTEFEIGPGDRVLLATSITFDLTQKNVFAPLLVGGQLHLLESSCYDARLIRRVIREAEITILNCTPSAFYPLVENANEDALAELASLRFVFLGGEPIAVARLAPWLGSSRCRAEVVNTYGPTECTDICAAYRLQDWRALVDRPVPIGKPVWNARLSIVGKRLDLLPAGVTGELCVEGDGVGEGYINNPELTTKAFLPSPYSVEPVARMYRTGDLARWLPDGNIELLGRIDHQVKVRGFRIELGEIEAALDRHPDVRESVVLAREDTPGDKRLVAYVVAKHERPAAIGELLRYLKEKVPDYMVPAVFVILEAMPLSPNGKVNRLALPAPSEVRPELESTYAAPQSELERRIVALWQELLRVDKAGVHDNFFDLGGHSLLIVQLQSRLSEMLQRDVPVIALFRYPTVASLARHLGEDPGEMGSFGAVQERVRKQREALSRRRQFAGREP